MLLAFEGNVIVGKLCDFGLSRKLKKNEMYIFKTFKTADPVKWAAPVFLLLPFED